MKTYEIVWKDRDPADDIFPDGLDWDETLVFHGTSSTREAAIDRDGLRPHAAGVSAASIRVIVECAKSLRWYGKASAGLGVLQAFTLRNDFRDGDASPLYLSERVTQAIGFAGRSYAGGEKVSAFLRGYEDLEKLVFDEPFRRAAIADREQWHGESPPPDLSAEDVARVRTCLAATNEAAEFARRERCGYRHAVVYAIRAPVEVRASWEDCRGMGLRVIDPIPTEWFVAKLRVLPPKPLQR